MSKLLGKRKFLASEEAEVLRQELMEMATDPSYNTKSTYTAGSPDDLSFVDKHMRYISNYSNIDPQKYVSNLKLMTRIRK